ncbi:hypothetical protein [Acetobacter fallax]|uniref:Uncharacterized protein n=1 Tax=Acetobacter fallax TaxID=1737473 RepID=A0ABX0K8D8_9PROT|nr:hypothetical protein [Acetobacter fallax]NHO32506.1 hypothetical protein [Acetobacter fallax]NHO36066.1 hypothetical protein [Acetobacter fallax]
MNTTYADCETHEIASRLIADHGIAARSVAAENFEWSYQRRRYDCADRWLGVFRVLGDDQTLSRSEADALS